MPAGATPEETASAPAGDAYQPPAVAWEEEFAPLAASNPYQCPGSPEDCP